MNPIGSGGVGLEALTVGRVGIDLYPEQSGRPLSQVTSFAKSLGGTATNVAVGAARLGRRVGLLTKVGNDEFGAFVRRSLVDFGVTTSFVATHPDLLTPVVFCALDPAEDPVLTFYRQPIAPDLTLTDDEIPWDVIVDVPVLWLTATGVSVEPARTTQFEMLVEVGRRDRTSTPCWTSTGGRSFGSRWSRLDRCTRSCSKRQRLRWAIEPKWRSR
jgi:5-dehydro-2-deoxygluconokinase